MGSKGSLKVKGGIRELEEEREKGNQSNLIRGSPACPRWGAWRVGAEERQGF